MDTKPFWHSRTLWFNLGAAVLEVLQALSEARVIPPEASVIGITVGNAVLRVLTSQPVGAK